MQTTVAAPVKDVKAAEVLVLEHDENPAWISYKTLVQLLDLVV